jgi:hypothetical protein
MASRLFSSMSLFPSNMRRLCLIVTGVALFSGSLAQQAIAQNEPKAEPKAVPALAPLFNIADPGLNELSGFAASRTYPGLIWAHNDSGDTARLFLINKTGNTVATVVLEGIEARDWEDISAAAGYLYIGDIGDNMRVMENIKIHRFQEPKLDPQKLGQYISLASANIETATVTYPDGPRDAESLAVGPDGSILIVSKSFGGSNFYVSQTVFRRGAVSLKKIGSTFQFGGVGLFTKLATSGDLSRDGKKLLIGTYSQLYEFALTRPFDFASIDTQNPKIQDLPSLKQSESACYDLDGKQIYVSSEKAKPPVYALNSLLK